MEIQRLWKFLIVVISILNGTFTAKVEREMTVEVPPGNEDCYFEAVQEGDIIDFDYQVIDGGFGDVLEINFKIFKPDGNPLVADFRRSDNTHRHHATESGDFKFCFDNSLHRLVSKVVFFEIVIDNDKESDDRFDLDLIKADAEEFGVKVEDLDESLVKIKDSISKTRHFQDQIRVYEFRDRSIAEHNFEIVNKFSIIHVIVMLLSGFLQVISVRTLFEDSSPLNNFLKKIIG